MRISYDAEANVVMVYLRERRSGKTAAMTKEVADGVIIDFGPDGAPHEIEILYARQRFDEADLREHDITTSMLSLAQAAERCGLSAGTLKLQAQAGKLKARKVGRNWVTTEAWLRSYLIERSRQAKEFEASEPGK